MNLNFPVKVTLGVTGRCNLRCKHCSSKETWDDKDLETSQILSLIEELALGKVIMINLFGGEPFLREDIFLVIENILSKNMAITVNTNATLISCDLARKLVRGYRVNKYIISLDGDKKEHEILRGKGSFDLAVRGIENIVKYGGEVILSCTITKINKDKVEDVVFLGKFLKVAKVRFNSLFYSGNSICNFDYLYYPAYEEKLLSEKIYNLSLKYPGFIVGSYLQKYKLMKQFEKSIPLKKQCLSIPPCGAGRMVCNIRPDGWVTPCETLWEVKVGNVISEKFSEIWRYSRMLKKFRKNFILDLSRDKDCQECLYKEICFKFHRCVPYYIFGKKDNKKLYCMLKK